MDLLKENSESEDLLKGAKHQLQECPVGQWKSRDGGGELSEGVKKRSANWICRILATFVAFPRKQQCNEVHRADAEVTGSSLMYREDETTISGAKRPGCNLSLPLRIYSFVDLLLQLQTVRFTVFRIQEYFSKTAN